MVSPGSQASPLPGPEGAGGNGPPDKAQRLSFCLDLKPGILEALIPKTRGASCRANQEAGGEGSCRVWQAPLWGSSSPRCHTPWREWGLKTEPGPAVHAAPCPVGKSATVGHRRPLQLQGLLTCAQGSEAAILTASRCTEGAHPAPPARASDCDPPAPRTAHQPGAPLGLALSHSPTCVLGDPSLGCSSSPLKAPESALRGQERGLVCSGIPLAGRGPAGPWAMDWSSSSHWWGRGRPCAV